MECKGQAHERSQCGVVACPGTTGVFIRFYKDRKMDSMYAIGRFASQTTMTPLHVSGGGFMLIIQTLSVMPFCLILITYLL